MFSDVISVNGLYKKPTFGSLVDTDRYQTVAQEN